MGWVVLLRGINVGGRNKVPMAELREMCTDLGLSGVTTYINSGNVLFNSKPVKGLETKLSAAIAERFGVDIPVVICTTSRLKGALANNPFPDQDPKKVLVYFCAGKPRQANVLKLDHGRSPGDALEVIGSEVFLTVPEGAQKTKFTLAYLEKTLAVTMTSRNINTVEKLCSLNY